MTTRLSTNFTLLQGDALPCSGLDDAAAFSDVCKALNVCDFTTADQAEIFNITAAVLHLGNTGFVEEDGEALIAQDKPIRAISEVVASS